MKRKIFVLTAAAICAASLCFNAEAGTVGANVSVNGENVSSGAVSSDKGVLVPARNVFTALGYEINYDSAFKQLYLNKKKKSLVLTAGSVSAEYNGETVTLSEAPVMKNGSFYVPLSVLDMLGYNTSSGDSGAVITDKDETSDDTWKKNTGSIDLDSLSVTGEGVSVSGNTVTVAKGGDITVKGSFNGSIVIDTSEKVKLRLAGVSITSADGPAIYVKNADKVYITAEEGTVNTLSDSAKYSDEDAKGALFSNDDLEIKGSGRLVINGNYKHGIACDDVLSIENGDIVIKAVGDGIHANDGVYISGGSVAVEAELDGIQSEGYIEISGGTLDIKTTGEVEASTEEFPGGGMRGNGGMKMQNEQNGGNAEGNTNQNAFGGRAEMQNGENTDKNTQQNGFGGRGTGQNGTMRGNMPPIGEMPMGEMPMGEMPQGTAPMGEKPMGEMPAGEKPQGMPQTDGNSLQRPQQDMSGGNAQSAANDEENSEISSKGLKADGSIIIKDGSIKIDSNDTCIKADGIVSVDGGSVSLVSNVKKGIKAVGNLFLNGGDVSVNAADEGLESKRIVYVNNGNITVNAKDDGINAGGGSGGMMGNASEYPYHQVVINGGRLYVNANGDGIDTNGVMTVNGGYTEVYGPTNGGNSALDSNGSIKINGGTILAVGSVGMVETPDSDSAQNVINMAFDTQQSAGTAFEINGSDGSQLVSAQPQKVYQSVIYSSPDIKDGVTYTVTANGSSAGSAEIKDRVTSIGSAAQRSMGGMDRGQRFEMNVQQ